MNCKHRKIKGNITKYFWCNLKEKSVDDYQCEDCPLKLKYSDLPEGFEEVFGKGFRR